MIARLALIGGWGPAKPSRYVEDGRFDELKDGLDFAHAEIESCDRARLNLCSVTRKANLFLHQLEPAGEKRRTNCFFLCWRHDE